MVRIPVHRKKKVRLESKAPVTVPVSDTVTAPVTGDGLTQSSKGAKIIGREFRHKRHKNHKKHGSWFFGDQPPRAPGAQLTSRKVGILTDKPPPNFWTEFPKKKRPAEAERQAGDAISSEDHALASLSTISEWFHLESIEAGHFRGVTKMGGCGFTCWQVLSPPLFSMSCENKKSSGQRVRKRQQPATSNL